MSKNGLRAVVVACILGLLVYYGLYELIQYARH